MKQKMEKLQYNGVFQINSSWMNLLTPTSKKNFIPQIVKVGLDVEFKDNGKIENEDEAWIVDFANMYIGGGVFAGGCVQEEILFLIYPQLLVTMLVAQKMDRNESISVQGLQRFNNYSGYQNTFKWEPIQFQIYNTHKIICIDAHDYSKESEWLQLTEDELNLELTKSFVGFKVKDNDVISTGRWGCGVFKGQWQLKLIIQLLAASAAGVQKLIYYNIGSQDQLQTQDEINKFQQSLRIISINSIDVLYKKLILWCSLKSNNRINHTLLDYFILF